MSSILFLSLGIVIIAGGKWQVNLEDSDIKEGDKNKILLDRENTISNIAFKPRILSSDGRRPGW
jgi:hypothetical protein